MTHKFFASTLLAIATIVAGVNFIQIKPTEAVEITNGQTAFIKRPRLTHTDTTMRGKNSSAAVYHFVISDLAPRKVDMRINS